MATALTRVYQDDYVDPDATLTTRLFDAERRLEHQDTWIQLITAAQKKDLKATAEIIVRLSNIYGENFDHAQTPAEFEFLKTLLQQSNLSISELKAYIQGNAHPTLAEKIETFITANLNTNFETAGTDRGVVLEHQKVIPRQPILSGWARELISARTETKDEIHDTLEALHTETRIFINELVDGSLEDEHQLIPDSLRPEALLHGIDKVHTAIISRLLAEGSLQSSTHIGLKKGAKRQADQQLAIIRANKKTALHRRLRAWAKENPTETVSPERVERMRKIARELLKNTRQVSEQSYEWVLLYALEATKEHPDETEFAFTTSLGGDQEPAPYPEAYIIEPLQKLRALKQLLDAGEINKLPSFEIVFTASSQLAENSFDRQGKAIDPVRHTHNSIVAAARIQDFIASFFPEIKDLVKLHYFPDYKRTGMFRVHLAAITENLPISAQDFEKLFKIKGDVQKEIDQSDPIQTAFRPGINIYPSRHKYSNGVASDTHTLRFGADRTEAPFHLIATAAKEAAQRTDIADYIRDRLRRGLFNGSSAELQAALPELEKQLALVRANESIHAQLGMKNVHACYYRGDFDPSINELIDEGRFTPRKLQERPVKLAKVLETFGRVTDAIGTDEYLGHIAKWADHYEYISMPHADAPNPHELAANLNARLISEAETRQFLNMHLK